MSRKFYTAIHCTSTEINVEKDIKVPSYAYDIDNEYLKGVYLQTYCCNFQQDYINESQVYMLFISGLQGTVINSEENNMGGIPLVFRSNYMVENTLDGNGTILGAATSIHSRSSVWGEYIDDTYELVREGGFDNNSVVIKIYDPINKKFLTSTEVFQVYLLLRLEIAHY